MPSWYLFIPKRSVRSNSQERNWLTTPYPCY
ncbi:hypothetical protein ACFSVN_12045 [Gracilimonas halophila]|uniref:Uncharacterized protein n=1 Tax=Gracilimonas halophila TaxID=1834464 RepID=A0ABW5JKX9_9BACT